MLHESLRLFALASGMLGAVVLAPLARRSRRAQPGAGLALVWRWCGAGLALGGVGADGRIDLRSETFALRADASNDLCAVAKEEYGITASMRRRGDCRDNALAARRCSSPRSLWRLHGQKFDTRRHAKDEVTDWLLWYNRARLHSTLACVNPVKFAQDRLAHQPSQVSS